MENYYGYFFNTYDITTEVVMFGMLVMLLAIIFISKPERTYMMGLCLVGIVNAMFTMILHVLLLAQTIHVRYTHDLTMFNILYILYMIFLVAELNFILLYILQLSYYLSVENGICRQIERIDPNLKIYKDGMFRFMAVCPVESEERFERIKDGF